MKNAGLYSPEQIVKSGLCIGCGSCVSAVKTEQAQMVFNKTGELKPVGDKHWYGQTSAQFSSTCPFSPSAKNEDELAAMLYPVSSNADIKTGRFESAWVGHVLEENFRELGSSGGMVSWVATELLKQHLVDAVAHVVASDDPEADGNFFHYCLSRTEEEIKTGARSRYYPIELSAILRMIRDIPGRYAVIGIPCFIKAVQLLRSEDAVLHDRIRFTLGLFCGHMKSARFVESIAWQLNVHVSKVSKVEYRYKDPGRPANQYTAMLTLTNGKQLFKDWWQLGDGDWGAGFFMNNACNFCDDVVAETADIAFGDAWVEPYSSDGRGTNVVVVRSKQLHKIITDAVAAKRLQLDAVDAAFIEQTQAAGFRQRREGLSYRLSWKRKGVVPIKRVAADATNVTQERKRLYRMRYAITKWSHLIFRFAKRINTPKLYIGWSRLAGAVYYGFAYRKGSIAEMKKRFKGFFQSS